MKIKGEYSLLLRFYDKHSGIFTIPGPIYHDSKELREEVVRLLSTEGNLKTNWAMEMNNLSNFGYDDWDHYYDFILNKDLLLNKDKCVASDWGNHEYSNILISIREVESF